MSIPVSKIVKRINESKNQRVTLISSAAVMERSIIDLKRFSLSTVGLVVNTGWIL